MAEPQIYTFDNSRDAYDEAQWNDEIKDGAVLVIPPEGIVGFLAGAWPVAVLHGEGGPGSFHTLADPGATVLDGRDYGASIARCREVEGVSDG